MKEKGIHAVTGAFGFSGRYIASRLLESEPVIRTLTNSPERPHPFGDRVEVHPYHFDDPDKLVRALEGVGVLYNTYWVRFNHSQFTFAGAVENSRTLFPCAVKAGVERIVHVSITNNSLDSPLEYFRGKARLEEELRSAAISHAILRPALLFGREDILINNIAWSCAIFPHSRSSGTGATGCSPSSWTTWPGWRSSRAGKRRIRRSRPSARKPTPFWGWSRRSGGRSGKGGPFSACRHNWDIGWANSWAG